MRKTFIKVRRGILEAKHVQTLGVRMPLYLLLLDLANWETGKVMYYNDQDAADQFELPIRKMRDWRRRLQDDGYISCFQKGNHQEITIKKWVDSFLLALGNRKVKNEQKKRDKQFADTVDYNDIEIFEEENKNVVKEK